MDYRFDVTFDHTGEELTYGPGPYYNGSYGEKGHEDYFSNIVSTLKSSTGGFMNHCTARPTSTMVVPQCKRTDEIFREYHIILFIPPMAASLFRLTPDQFWKDSGIDYWVEKLELKNLKGVLYSDA